MSSPPSPQAGFIRTFHPRRGRVTPHQAWGLREHASPWLLAAEGPTLDLAALFGVGVPVVLEIGFGMGEATLAMTAEQPDQGVLAIDVHTPGVGQLLAGIGESRLTNLRVMQADAVEVVRERLAPGSLSGVRIFFPDPWPKSRHHKRRLVQPPFVSLLCSRLAPGAFVHCATDWPPYAEQMLEVMTAEPRLRAVVVDAGSDPGHRPLGRPETRFERRGLARGHLVSDLVFTRTLDA